MKYLCLNKKQQCIVACCLNEINELDCQTEAS